MMNALKRLFKKPTPLERAARELGLIEHAILDCNAEISWSKKRLEYHTERQSYLKDYINNESR